MPIELSDVISMGLRRRKPVQRPLLQRIDCHNGHAAPPCAAPSSPRAVGAGILADQEDGFGECKILEDHRPLAGALRETDARRLVAHVRAVGKIAGAEPAHEQLIQKGRLIGGVPGGIEVRLVRAFQGATRVRSGQMPSSHLIGT
jgi:hypothetical protein